MKEIQVKNRQDCPSYSEWEEIIGKALAQIRRGKFEKVVLARKTTFELEKEICPFDLLQRVKTHNCTLFAHVTDKQAFIGATPETLYRREGNLIFTHALAGTALNPADLERDKETREFAYVSAFIEEKLRDLCSSVKVEKPNILYTGHLYHKQIPFSGVLKPGISDAEIIAALHPTPAIGGFPRKEALDFIKNHEPFSRDLYASPIGYMSPERAEFVVAIRSCFIEGNKLHLFAGAGIVEGSDPEKEWEELENKIAPFIKVLQC